MNTTPVQGQVSQDDLDRRTEPRSSVSDLVNSLTSEMLMVSGLHVYKPDFLLDINYMVQGNCTTKMQQVQNLACHIFVIFFMLKKITYTA